MKGVIDAKNIFLIKNKTEKFNLDFLSIISTEDPDGKNHFDLQSDLASARVDGFFDLGKIHQDFIDHFAKFHPRFALDLGLKPTKPIVGIALSPLKTGVEMSQNLFSVGLNQQTLPRLYDFNVNIEDSKNWTHLFDNQLDTLKKIGIEGSYDEASDDFKFSLDTEETHRYGNVKLVALGLTLNSQKQDLEWKLKTYNCVVNDNLDFQDITFENLMTGDTIEFGLTSTRFSQKLRLKNLELNANLMRQDSFYKLSFGTSQLSRINILEDVWDIAKDNYILLGRNYLDIKGFDLHNADRQITLESCEGRGLNATLNNFTIDFVNAFMGKDEQRKFKLGGKYFVNLEVEDIFKQENFKVNVAMDSFFVKDEYRGALRVNAIGKDLKSPIYSNILLLDNEKRLSASGHFYPKATDRFPENAIDVTLGLQNFPFKTLQLVIEMVRRILRATLMQAFRCRDRSKI
ncbi:MAG: hypothetical protein HC817_12970 [Saprospiraceae bacterium]|nr:hypothetical protein [Saprospiraceae bacterium]